MLSPSSPNRRDGIRDGGIGATAVRQLAVPTSCCYFSFKSTTPGSSAPLGGSALTLSASALPCRATARSSSLWSVRSRRSGVIEVKPRDTAHLSEPSSRFRDWNDGEPEMRPIHRVATGYDLAVVEPPDCFVQSTPRMLAREVHVPATTRAARQQLRKNFVEARPQRVEVGLVLAERDAESDPWHAHERGLLCRRQRPGMPNAVTEIRTEIDPRQDHVDLVPLRDPERDAVRGRAVDAVRLDRVRWCVRLYDKRARRAVIE